MDGIEVVLDAQATIGESPTWSAEEQALYWIDIKAPALFRYDPATGAQKRWALESDVGGFALYPDLSAALVALRTGLFRLDLASSGLVRLAPPPFDPALHRFNEAGCDPSGRFWVGVMFDPLVPGGQPVAAGLHSYSTADGLRREPDSAELHNGMAWSADNRSMFLAHSNRQSIYRYPLATDGQLSEPQLFATVPDSDGLPDGAAVDTQGGYWCALHGGFKLRRFNPDGSTDRDVALPVSQPTMCAFGGADLDELYVTSATDKLDAAQRRREPHAGALLRLKPGERGIPRRCTLS